MALWCLNNIRIKFKPWSPTPGPFLDPCGVEGNKILKYTKNVTKYN